LLGSLGDTVCSGNTPPKTPYTAHESRNRAELGFTRPYGIPHDVFASLTEHHTVRHSRPKSGYVLGDRRAPDGGSRMPTIEAPCAHGGSSCVFADHQSSGKREPHRRLRSGIPVCSEAYGFPYGLAKSRTENPQVMGQVGNARGSCWCGPLLSDELQKSWSVRFPVV